MCLVGLSNEEVRMDSNCGRESQLKCGNLVENQPTKTNPFLNEASDRENQPTVLDDVLAVGDLNAAFEVTLMRENFPPL